VSRPGGSTNSYGGCPPDERILASLKIRQDVDLRSTKIGARYSHILFALLETLRVAWARWPQASQ